MNRIFKNTNLLIFLVGSFISGLGTRLTTLALSDKILALTGDDFSVSLVFLLEGLPMLLFGVIAGSFVDKHNKKYIFIAVNLLFALTSFAFGLTAIPLILYAVMLFNGLLQTLYFPARVALMPLLVRKEDLAEANGLRASINGIISIVGYAFAGMVVAYAGNTLAFYLDSASFVLIALLFLLLKPNEEPKESSNTPLAASFKQDIKEGWGFIKSNSYVKHMFFLEVLTRFIIAMQIPLTYVFVRNYLGGQALVAERSGLLFSAAGIGTLLGGLLIGRFKSMSLIKLLAASLLCDGIVVGLFAVNSFFPASMLLFAFMGIIGAFMGSLLETVIQKNTPDELLGRVSGFINTVVEPLSVMSILIGGLASGIMEVKHIFLLCAFAEILTGLYFFRKYTAISNSISAS